MVFNLRLNDYISFVEEQFINALQVFVLRDILNILNILNLCSKTYLFRLAPIYSYQITVCQRV